MCKRLIIRKRKEFVHPYIPNSVPQVKARMLKDIDLTTVVLIL